METRKQFISRMQWMIAEIKSSDFSDAHILTMLEYEMQQRDKKIIKDTKRKVFGVMDLKKSYGHTTNNVLKIGIEKIDEIANTI
tara:strand:- start:2510 stop:2761 length:252 start_codon:yes stop_codon:yes gene_type:complete